MYVYHELCTACAFSDGCPKGLRYSVKKKVVMTHSTHTCVCVQAIRVVCRSFLYSIHQSTGLKGIMKRLWTMSWDLELCVYPTMYGKNDLSTACAFSDGCPKELRYSVKKKVVMTHITYTWYVYKQYELSAGHFYILFIKVRA